MHDIHDGSDFRLHDDYGISVPSVGEGLIFAFSWVHCSSSCWFFSLGLTVRELRAIFFAVCLYNRLFPRGDTLDNQGGLHASLTFVFLFDNSRI